MKSIFVVCLALLVNFTLAQVDSMPEEGLRKSLMDKYNKDVLPPHNKTHPVKVGVGYTLVSIRDVDERLRKIEVIGWLKMSWNDSRLTWDPKQHDGIEVLRMGAKYLWIPDLTLYNRAEVPTESPTEHALLYSTGKVVWIPWSHLTAICMTNSTYYPYDTHNCSLKFGSWVYDGFHLDFELHNDKSDVDLSEMLQSNEWEVVSTSAKKTMTKYECCEEFYPDITFRLILQRHSSMHQTAIQFPMVSAVLLAFTAFLISPFNKQRLLINAFDVILLLLTLIYLQQLIPIYALNPPAIVLICECMILIVVLAMVWNIALMSLNRRCCKLRPPQLVQWLTHSWMVKVLLIPKSDNKQEFCNIEQLDHSHDDQNMIDIASDDKSIVMNVWVTFFLLLDRLVFISFITVFISLLSKFTS